jgi:hypothetical protein
MDTCPAYCFDLELVCGATRSSGCRQRPSGPPRERLRTCSWGQFFGYLLNYLELFTRQSTAGPRGVPELEVRERPPSTLRNTLTVGPREVLKLKVRKLEMWMAGPLGGCWRHVWQWTPPKLKMLMAGHLGGAGGMSGSGHHRSWRRRWWAP